MPPKRGTNVGKPPGSANKKGAASSSSSTPTVRASSAAGSRAAAAAARKREHAAGTSGDSPEKKREAGEEPSNCIFLCGFTGAEMEKYQTLIKDPWTIEETFTDSITHLVIKSMSALKTTQQLLPIYYAVLKGIWVLKPSFLPAPSNRRKSLGGHIPLENEEDHEYDGKEIDANAKSKADFPSIVDIVRIRSFVRDLKDNDSPLLLGSEPFRKVAILAGRTKDSKQRREELKLVMEAGGATVVEDTVFKTWKAKRKKGGDIEIPSMVVIVNGETNVSSLGLDDDIIRDLLKARSPLFYEEFMTTIFMHTMMLSLDDLLLQCFVFIHEQMKTVDPYGKLQERVMGDEDNEDGRVTPSLGEKTPSGRRANSRVSSSARELSSNEQIGKEKRKGKREKDEEEEMEEEEKEKETPPKKVKEEEKEDEAPIETKRGRGRPKKNEKKEEEKGEEVKEEKMMEDETAKAPKKEVKRGRPRKDSEKKEVKKEEEEKKEKKEEGKKEEKKEVKKEEEGKKEEKEEEKNVKKEDEKKEVKKDQGEEMEVDDVDPSLADENLDLMAEFEREIEERSEGGRREERSEREMRELREMREDRGDIGEEEEGEAPVTPEPILFSQLATQPAIEIPEDLRRALEVKEEETDGEDNGSKKDEEEEKKSQKTLTVPASDVNEDNASDDGSGTIVVERDGDIEEMERLREEMNNEMGGEKKEDEEDEKKSVTPQGDEAASEFGLKSVVTMTTEDTKDCETCNHLGTQNLYINQQLVAEIEEHFSSPRLEWFDFIVHVKEKMPWIKEGKVLRPYRERDSPQIRKYVVDLFYNFYHELNDNEKMSTLLSEINSSDAMEMYEAEWDEKNPRRPPLDLMIKMLHEFSVKCHSEDLDVPERACSALKNAISVILPSSVAGRHYWLTVLAGGSVGIKGRASQVVEEMARRCKTFFIKAFISGCFHHSIVQFVAYYCEVDLLCAQTPVVQYETKKKKKQEEDSMESQRTTRGKKNRIITSPLESFPLVLLLVMDLNESPRRGLSESALLVIQKMMEMVLALNRHRQWAIASSLQRALLCLLEAARWHCGQAASSALTGAERRRVKAVESASQNIETKITVELQQNIQRVIRLIVKKGVPKKEVRESLPLSWLEDIVDAMQ